MTTSSRWEEFKISMQPRIKEWKFMLRRMRESPLSIAGIAIIVGFIIIALLAPVLAPPTNSDPFIIPSDDEISKLDPTPIPPSTKHLFGTTGIHQYDIYYACIWGTITAFRVGITTVAISLIIGLTVGVAAAYYGGMADEVLMRFTDIIIAFPGLILAMALVIAIPSTFSLNISLILTVILGLTVLFMFLKRVNMKITAPLLIIFIVALVSLFNPINLDFNINRLDKVLIALWLIGWPSYARVIRGEVLRVKNEDFVEAAKAAGASDLRIVMKHLLPNSIYPVLIMASLDTGSIVLTAAALSFLGLGAPTNYADWGQIIQRSQTWIYAGGNLVRNMHVFLIPGIFIFVFVLGWNLLGDAFRDVLDPTLRRR